MIDFEQRSIPVPFSGCHLWLGYCYNGYGIVWVGHKNRKAHVVAYEQAVGLVPDGMDLDHTCRVRSCVNPAHLEPVTRSENVLRSPEHYWFKRISQDECIHGHPLKGANLYWHPKGHRICRTCNRIRAQRTREARRANALLSN